MKVRTGALLFAALAPAGWRWAAHGPGNPDTTMPFPQQMLVDWVRVSQL